MQVEKRTDEPVLLRGYAAVFNKLSQPLGFSHYRERIAPGAFTETIKNDDIRALVDHERGRIIGRNVAGTLRLKEDKKGLRYEVDLPSTSVGQDIAISVERGDVSGSSFGFITLSDEWKTEDGEEVRTIGKVKLVDVSPCTFPAYPDTSVAMRSLEQWRQTQQPGYGRELLRGKLTILEAEQSMLEE
ncbi:MAG: hypothetical protein AMJ84_05435 [Acidithiobacillales bacterium SM23_46]|nr:MAG: hypothetical protein AMJ84_05435 [Acidithiobacillales bacterium SM23_46]KPL27980.1 MAG: hypothetical protein AMJ72_05920 [Acidithiobacillales bacterium SM1_46]